MSVAAAAHLEPVSPELALVDAALAARLRAILDAPMRQVATTPSGPDRDEPGGDPVEDPAFASIARVDENDPIADLIVQGPESRLTEPSMLGSLEHDPSADPFVEEPQEQAELSRYPALPSPADGGSEQMDATETVLREIRDRLATPTSETRRRRFRRRFTVASGLSAAIALGTFATNVGLGVTQLHV